ncbi:unnamed protein product [Diatraea saccharalis]|uniref:Uncharacterized protein n=1 Tax=Diatraea saccharalis TaxID=40085 RepID=A0A9N9QVX0_9NEOP|nr:unnamed protein product [Diatraea saccharalis]
MYYVDSQRTLTRRESSLLTSRRTSDDDKTEYDVLSLAPPRSIYPLTTNTASFEIMRPKGSFKNELVTMMFESMLDCIVDTWKVIVPPKVEEIIPQIPLEKTASETTFASRKRKSISGG